MSRPGVFLTVAALAVCGCGSKLGEVADGSSGTSSDGASVDGGAAQDALPITGTGTLFLLAYGGGSGEVAAVVPIVEAGVGPGETCAAPLDAGACELTACQMGGIGSPSWGDGNFGPISAAVGTTTVALTYDKIGYPTVYFPSSVTLGEGGLMRFRGGDGASVPVFDVSATIPGLAAMTAPAAAADGSAAIVDASRDLSVTWPPISVGQVRFHLTGGAWSIGDVGISVACTYEGSAGSGLVPQTILAALKEMSGANPTYAGMISELDATTVVDGLTIVTQSYQNPPMHDIEVTLE